MGKPCNLKSHDVTYFTISLCDLYIIHPCSDNMIQCHWNVTDESNQMQERPDSPFHTHIMSTDPRVRL